METLKTEGIVLSVSRYKDADALATLLTKNGIKKVKFIGVRKAKAKFAFAAQPFCHAEFLLSGANDYAVIMGVEQKTDFYNLALDYNIFELASSMLSIIKRVATEEQDSAELFDLLLLSLSLLIANVDMLVVESIFKARLIKNLGIFYNCDKCAKCGKPLLTGALVDTNTGAIYCKDCGAENCTAVSKNILEYLNNILNKNISEIIKLNIGDGVKKQTNEILNKIINNQL